MNLARRGFRAPILLVFIGFFGLGLGVFAYLKQQAERRPAERHYRKRPAAQTELERAQVNVRSDDAQLTSAWAQVNLHGAVIASLLNGTVVPRHVNVSQAVAASMQTPMFHVLAADPTRRRVNEKLDEADIGRVRQEQIVSLDDRSRRREIPTG
jgi:multidrug resistance efflux pump